MPLRDMFKKKFRKHRKAYGENVKNVIRLYMLKMLEQITMFALNVWAISEYMHIEE